MEAHVAVMLAVQQLFTDAARQQQASSAAALEHLRAVEAQAQAAEEDAVSGPMFDRFDSAGPGGRKDGRITAEEFRDCIDQAFHCSAAEHVFTLSHARLMIRLVDANGDGRVDRSEFTFLWRTISRWSNFFLAHTAAAHPAYGPVMPLTSFAYYLREQLLAMRAPADGTDAQARAKVDAIAELVCASVAGVAPDFVLMSDFYTAQASLALAGRFAFEGGSFTKLDMVRCAFYLRG